MSREKDFRPGAFTYTIRDREQYTNERKDNPLARRRYQKGNLELRSNNVWTIRFREDMVQPDGSVRRVETRRVVGSRAEFPTKNLPVAVRMRLSLT